MAGTQHTQTHPKFIYTFLALHHDRMADGATTVHVAADTLVDDRLRRFIDILDRGFQRNHMERTILVDLI